MDGFKSLFTAIVENTGSWSLERTEVAGEELQRCRSGIPGEKEKAVILVML